MRPVDIKAEYEHQYPKQKPKTLEAYVMALKRSGLTKQVRDKQAETVIRKEEGKHILDYPEVANYVLLAENSRVQQSQIENQKRNITKIWEIMGRTDPHTWTYQTIMEGIANHEVNGKKIYEKIVDERGRAGFQHPGAVLSLLSAVNTIFPNKMPKGFGTGLTREAGELKDYLTFEEVNLFLSNLQDTPSLCLEGWKALFAAQINMGCREGTNQTNGICNILWENIDYAEKRMSIREKGGRGKASRLWKNVPLDLFPWLNGWKLLMAYHQKRFGYTPTNDMHETGRVWGELHYAEYSAQFHATRKRCNGRIAGNKETMRPHVLRKTHAQWLVKLFVPMEQICGIFPDGHFGVGWDNPAILMKYYVTLEDKQRSRAEKQAQERMQALGLIPTVQTAPLLEVAQ